MIVSITDSLDDDDDYRKEGSKGGGGGGEGRPTHVSQTLKSKLKITHHGE